MRRNGPRWSRCTTKCTDGLLASERTTARSHKFGVSSVLYRNFSPGNPEGCGGALYCWLHDSGSSGPCWSSTLASSGCGSFQDADRHRRPSRASHRIRIRGERMHGNPNLEIHGPLLQDRVARKVPLCYLTVPIVPSLRITHCAAPGMGRALAVRCGQDILLKRGPPGFQPL